jgi:two-component system, cell cycle sensor histidine kinase and response regulator CckA
MLFGIVKQNSGFINVYSEPGRGTTFTIYLPRHTGENGEVLNKIATELPPRGNETILLVEDEPTILEMASLILKGLGYTVVTAGTGNEAIRLFMEQADTIQMLMTDVVMPDMNGRDLQKELQLHSPQLKCLFMSGYTANVIAHHGVLDEGVHFIHKPFSVLDLASKVREVLACKSETT